MPSTQPENKGMVEPLLKYAEVEKILGVSNRHLCKLVKTGSLPAIRFGSCVRFCPDDLRSWINKHKAEVR